jgi:hypothetical protein
MGKQTFQKNNLPYLLIYKTLVENKTQQQPLTLLTLFFQNSL